MWDRLSDRPAPARDQVRRSYDPSFRATFSGSLAIFTMNRSCSPSVIHSFSLGKPTHVMQGVSWRAIPRCSGMAPFLREFPSEPERFPYISSIMEPIARIQLSHFYH